MKIFSAICIAIALGLIIFNTTKIDFSSPFNEDGTVALIGIVSGLIAIVVLIIFNMSKAIERKSKL